MKRILMAALIGLLCGDVAAQQPVMPALYQLADLGPGRWSGFAVSRTGRFVLYANASGQAYAFDRTTEATRALDWSGEPIGWSPSADEVAFWRDQRLWIAGIDSVLLTLRGEPRELSQRPDWLQPYPAGNRVRNENGFPIAELDLPLDLRLVGWLENNASLLGLHERVYTNLRIADSTGAVLIARTQRAQDGPPAWSPDDQYVAFTTIIGERRQLALLRAETGSREHLQSEVEPAATPPLWSPGGRYFAVPAKDENALLVVDLPTQVVARYASQHGTIRSVAWIGPALLRYAAGETDSLTVVQLSLGGHAEVVGRAPYVSRPPAPIPVVLARDAAEVSSVARSRRGRFAYLDTRREALELWEIDVRRILAR